VTFGRSLHDIAKNCGFRIVYEEGQRFPDMVARLLERCTVGMATGNCGNGGDPVTRLVHLIVHYVFSRWSQLSPRHGVRSLTIWRKVPGGTS
jgi:hypothetical protein